MLAQYLFKRTEPTDGFIVLIIVIIAGVLATTTASGLLVMGAMGGETSLDAEQSYITQGATNACAEAALEQIYNNFTFTGTNNVTIGPSTCSYTIASATVPKTVTATTTVNSIKRKLSITVTQVEPVIIYTTWVEN